MRIAGICPIVFMVTKGFYLPCLSHRLERGEWTAMKMRKVLHGAQASRPHFLRLLTLCAFFAAGIIAGQLIGPPLLKDGGSELTEYLQSYAGVASELTAEPLSLLRVLAAYFRVPLLLLLLGFCTFGAVMIPVVCAVQGFLLSFAVSCFAAAYGSSGLMLTLAAFGVRAAILLPCVLLIAQWAFDRTVCRLQGEKAAPGGGRRRLFLCFVLLLVGTVLELAVVPRLIALALGSGS